MQRPCGAKFPPALLFFYRKFTLADDADLVLSSPTIADLIVLVATLFFLWGWGQRQVANGDIIDLTSVDCRRFGLSSVKAPGLLYCVMPEISTEKNSDLNVCRTDGVNFNKLLFGRTTCHPVVQHIGSRSSVAVALGGT